jgi:SRSO17 transposase
LDNAALFCALMKLEMSKRERTTDYVAKQYIGNIGQTANGIVSVNAYAVVDKLTYPLLFKIFKPKSRLQADDDYKTKPQLAIEILQGSQSIRVSS